VNIFDIVFAVIALNKRGDAPESFLGNAFAVTGTGGLLTCRHVVDGANGRPLGVVDIGGRDWCKVETVAYPDDEELDLAFLPSAVQRHGVFPLPLLVGVVIPLGEDAIAYGYLVEGFGSSDPLVPTYHRGHIVAKLSKGSRLTPGRHPSWALSFPVIEGLSGSPVTTDHNGMKLIGICYGVEQQRTLAHEVTVVERAGETLREEIHRVVEYGLAYQPQVIESFLSTCAPGEFVVSDLSPGDMSGSA